MVKKRKFVGVCEIKDRDLYEGQYPTYLITADKITNGVKLASLLVVPFYIFACLNIDDIIIGFRVWDKEYLFPYEVKRTETQETINGGTAIRDNAYIPFKYGRRVNET